MCVCVEGEKGKGDVRGKERRVCKGCRKIKDKSKWQAHFYAV